MLQWLKLDALEVKNIAVFTSRMNANEISALF